MPSPSPEPDPAIEARYRRVIQTLDRNERPDSAELAARFRAEVREAIAAGDFPRVEESVRSLELDLGLTPMGAPTARRSRPRSTAAPVARPTISRTQPSWSLLGPPKPPMGNPFRLILRPSPTRRRFAVAVFMGAIFASILAGLAQGRLLYGVDTVGTYTPQDFLYWLNADALIPSFVSLLDGSNPYLTLYISLAVEAGFAAYCAQFLGFQFARGRFAGFPLIGVEVACAALYLGNPYILSFGTTSILSNVLVSSSAVIAVAAILIGVIRDANAGTPIAPSTALWLGVAIGLADPQSTPNFLRVQLLFVVAIALAAFYLVVLPSLPVASARRRRGLRQITILRFAAFALPVAAVLLAYPIWYSVTHFLLAKGAVASIISSQPGLSVQGQNTLGMVVRLLGKRTIVSYAFISQYRSFTLVAFASWLWPTFALGVPFLAVLVNPDRFVEWRWIVAVEVLAWICIAWSCASNPPFGVVVGPLSSSDPTLAGAIPIYYLEFQVLSWLFALLAATSAVWIGRVVHDFLTTSPTTPAPTPTPGERTGAGAKSTEPWFSGPVRWSQVLSVAAVFFIVVLLLCVDAPVGSGQALSPNGRVPAGGFEIPSEYSELRGVLHGTNGNTLLLPGINPYVTTSWNFYGGSDFYSAFFYPKKIVVPAFYGAFGFQGNPANARSYSNLTSPLAPGPATSNLTSDWNPSGDPMSFPAQPTIVFHTSPSNSPVNLSGAEWLGVTVNTTNSALLSRQLATGGVWLNITSGGKTNLAIDAFQATDGFNVNVTNLSQNRVRIEALLAFPDRLQGSINLTAITGIRIGLQGPVSSGAIVLHLLSVQLWNESAPTSSWNLQVFDNDITSILVDTTLVRGWIQPISYAALCVSTLADLGLVKLTWRSTDLSLYTVVSP